MDTVLAVWPILPIT